MTRRRRRPRGDLRVDDASRRVVPERRVRASPHQAKWPFSRFTPPPDRPSRATPEDKTRFVGGSIPVDGSGSIVVAVELDRMPRTPQTEPRGFRRTPPVGSKIETELRGFRRTPPVGSKIETELRGFRRTPPVGSGGRCRSHPAQLAACARAPARLAYHSPSRATPPGSLDDAKSGQNPAPINGANVGTAGPCASGSMIGFPIR